MKTEAMKRESFCVGGDSREGQRPDRYGDTKRKNALLDHHDPAGAGWTIDLEDQMKEIDHGAHGNTAKGCATGFALPLCCRVVVCAVVRL